MNRVVNVLRAGGVKKGDRVFIQVGRLPEWWETMLACLKMGAIAMPGTVMLTPKDIAYRMELSEPAAVVTEAAIAPRFDEARGKSSRSRPISRSAASRTGGWTSAGSATGRRRRRRPSRPSPPIRRSSTSPRAPPASPRWCSTRRRRYGIGHVVTARYWLDLEPERPALEHLRHRLGEGRVEQLLRAVHRGRGAARPQPNRRVQRQAGAATSSRSIRSRACAARRRSSGRSCSRISGKWTFPHLRECVAAGEPLNPEVIATWKAATGLEIRDGYGQTETVLPGRQLPGAHGQARVDGQALAGLRHRDHRRRRERRWPRGRRATSACGSSRRGRSASSASTGRTTRRTGAPFRGDYYITGDRGVMDEDGYVWFVGRADDVILSAGYRIGPFEVESALLEHASVAESAVVVEPGRHPRGDREGLRRPQGRLHGLGRASRPSCRSTARG